MVAKTLRNTTSAEWKTSRFEATFLMQEYVAALMKKCKEHRTENEVACEDSVALEHDTYMIGYTVLWLLLDT